MHKSKMVTATALAAALGTLGVTAQAQDGPPRMPDPFGDATVARADAQTKAEEQFVTLDADHDGSLSSNELEAMMPNRPPGMGRPGMDGPGPGMGGPGMGGPGMGGPGLGGGPPPGPPPGRMGMRADANGDGKVSKDEFTAAAMHRFDMADANHDGQLTKLERDAERKAMRERWQERRGGMGGMSGGDHDLGPPPGDDPGGPGGPGGPPPTDED